MVDPLDEAAEKIVRKLWPSPGQLCTPPLKDLFDDYNENVGCFILSVKLAHSMDTHRLAIAKAMTVGGSKENLDQFAEIEKNPDAAQKQLARYSWVNSRNLTNATVAAVQRYFSHIIREVATRRPEVLKSRETIRIDEVLSLNGRKEIEAYVIEKKLHELSYGGLRDMETFFTDRLGVSLFRSETERALFTLFTEIRNINLHNGGVVNDLLLSRVGAVKGFELVRGQRCLVDLVKFVDLASNALGIAASVDEVIAMKFGIKRKKYATWRRRERERRAKA